MEYSNPQIPEGINVTDEHPLKDFFFMLLGVASVVVLVIVLLSLMAEYLVRFIPFEVEQKLAQHFSGVGLAVEQLSDQDVEHNQRIEKYLQQLGDELINARPLPSSISVNIHYLALDDVNAVATLGGNIFIFQGLIEKMPNENALAMVIAHEIEHVTLRHPIIAMGRGLTVGIALMSIVGVDDSAVAQRLVGSISMLTNLNFSREQERQADTGAFNRLQALYGHTHGAEDLFQVFMSEHADQVVPAFLSTHPLSEERLERALSLTDGHNDMANENEQTRLLPAWLVSP
jgi:predicted Zn-dependent protease